MKLFHYAKDGGPESTVRGFWLIEAKSLFSIALLRFSNGSRDNFHSHAFDSLSWVLTGSLAEQMIWAEKARLYRPRWLPIVTEKWTFHKVISKGTSWVFTIRGPWKSTWEEYDVATGDYVTLGHGRKIISRKKEE